VRTRSDFISLIVEELTRNGTMEPGRMFERLYIDHAPTGPDYYFPEADVDVVVDIVREVNAWAVPIEVA
jgi:type I restriction enzyme, R subunit